MFWFKKRVLSRKNRSSSSSAPPTIANMSTLDSGSRTSILDLPNELLIPILNDVVATIKPHEAIRSGIVKLSSTCQRFHQIMQLFLESTCYIGISIPVKEPGAEAWKAAPVSVSKPVTVSYRLLRYNTKGARGPFVRKLDIYGGFRSTYPQYQGYQNRGNIISRPDRQRKIGGSKVDIVANALHEIPREIIPKFNNLLTASIQNTPDSLFTHLIPGLQAVLAYCPLLATLKLQLVVSIEKSNELEALYKGLADGGMEPSARLSNLDIFITERNMRTRLYPIEILGRVFGSSISSVKTLSLTYIAGETDGAAPTTPEPPEKWKLPSLRCLKFPATSEHTNKIITDYLDVDYHYIQEMTISGLLAGSFDPDKNQATSLIRQMSGLKSLCIEVMNNGNVPWLEFILFQDIPTFFPSLYRLEVIIERDVWRSAGTAKMEHLVASLKNLGLKYEHQREVDSIDSGFAPGYINGSDITYRFFISNR
ncbi:hypothetical protein TWF730_010213 [Orbilia blumenaviensis]|uniref:F-box domain-containing protein n=1 Tax=Orbilia blumenaviensis TaxID=1796055 RepID=A0AAV9UQ45_9PEZI